ncbi:carboxy terminal-processing peptidase [Xanthovirga aplysinae]|uniref:carboxy terminal-processing peptidase n=1 Tax=Xanthovirga aplysinae TaxID=2529853 RepID=UPI0012BC69F9|nr:carboxy terminal-processing peptidase [Xanthovirga aplysinae]MTI32965.1 tail-specific protease [Xanthovirga aplysinae]
MMKRLFAYFILFITLSGTPLFADGLYVSDTSKVLLPEGQHINEAKLIAGILENYHYGKTVMGDSLSSFVLDSYIKSLDSYKVYFLESDIKGFEKYRNQIVNDIEVGDIIPGYEIYGVFQNRFENRMNKVRNLLDNGFDFSVEESYDVDREDVPWAKNEQELDEVWRKMVKGQVLNYVLSGKSEEESIDVIRKRYKRMVKSASQRKSEDIFQLFMNAFAESFDPHTSYFSPQSSDNFKISMSNSVEGIGASLKSENDYTLVNEVIAGGPAFKSNLIHKGDKIIAVAQGEEGEMVDVVGWRLDDVVEKIRGTKGSIVRLRILDGDEGANALPKEIKLVRDKVKLEDQLAEKKVYPIEKDGKEYKIGVIKLPSFYLDFDAARKGEINFNSTTRDVRRLLGELKEEGIDGLVIDLQYNGGGSLQEAIDLTGLFIPEGPVVQIRNADGSIEVGADTDKSVMYSGPLAVLVNRFSASASEIFAGAIQDYKRGIVLGEQTYGKGTVQNIFNLKRFLPNEKGRLGELKFTLAKFYRITGSSTQHKGVTPDINFPGPFSAEEFGESSNESALPWDKIGPTRFVKTNDVNKGLISRLTNVYQKDLKEDSELINLQKEIEEIKQDRANTIVSLNKAERIKERELKEKKKENLTADASDKIIKGGGRVTAGEGVDVASAEVSEEETDEELDDVYLTESLNLVFEMLRNSSRQN